MLLKWQFKINGIPKRQLHPEREYVIILTEVPLVV